MADQDAIRDPAEEWRDGLEQKCLRFQRCAACGHAWLPPREDCPQCWSPDWAWRDASGDATVVSWVVYHVAFDPRFKDRVPYNVALVELAEGPRMITNLVEMPADRDLTGQRATMIFEQDFGRWLPRFRLSEGGGGRRQA